MKVSGTVLRKVATSCGLVSLAFANANAQGSDPFATLFGDVPKDVYSHQTGVDENNISLVGVQLHQFDLIDVISAYAIPNDLCVEAAPIFEAFKLPLNINEGRVSGWIDVKEQRVDVDLHTGRASLFGRDQDFKADIQQTPQGWCISLSALSNITKIDFTYEQSTLMVRAIPRKTLPLEAKLEREQIRKSLLAETETSRPNYSDVETPYNWLSFPVADIRMDIKAGANSDVLIKPSIELAGDFLKATARLRSVENDGKQALRFTLGRVSERNNQLGPLRARQFSIGDITAPALSLSVKSKAGRGLFISNVATYRPALFDTTQIVGFLPQGWEAELYQDERLIRFSDKADENGNYVFEDVPLMLGYNRLVVKLYGPYGETEERVASQFVGGAQCPDNELRYAFGVVDPHVKKNSEFDLALAIGEENSIDVNVDSTYAFSTFEYGVNKNFSARLDTAYNLEETAHNTSLSLLGSFKSMHGGARLASDLAGAYAYEAFMQSRLSERTSFSTRWTEFGAMESEYSGAGEGRLVRQGRLRLDTQFGFQNHHIPVQTTLNWSKRANGETNLSALAVASANFKGVNWSHSLRHTQSRSANQSGQNQTDGSLITSKSLKGFRVRAGLSYALQDGFDVSAISASVQKTLKDKSSFQASSTYDMTTQTAGLEASYSKVFRNMTLSNRIGVDQDGKWQAGVNLAFSLYKPKEARLYKMAPPGLSRSGAIRLSSFDDVNGNSRFDEGDLAVKGTKYIIDNSLRSESSGEDGVSLISGVESYKSTDIELQLSSLEDPFLKPLKTGRAITLRPGHVVDVPFPLIMTGDVDGHVTLGNNGHKIPLAGVSVEVISADGDIIETGISEYDGYFYIENIPATKVLVRVAPESLSRIEGQSSPLEVSLSRENPAATNINLVIAR